MMFSTSSPRSGSVRVVGHDGNGREEGRGLSEKRLAVPWTIRRMFDFWTRRPLALAISMRL